MIDTWIARLCLLSPLLACDAAQGQSAPAPHEAAILATPEAAEQGKTEIVRVPVPLPLPGQLKPMPARSTPEPADPRRRVARANAAARMQPAEGGFLNAMQHYAYAEGALYQLYCAPGQVSDIALQEGEQLVGPGPVAAGDTVRWIIGDTISGSASRQRVHILVKPTRSGLVTNLVINTDRRTYHIELRSMPETYMASISWSYPQDALIAIAARARERADAATVIPGVDVDRLTFRYRISGDRTAWRPVRAFDDGRQAFIELPPSVAESDLPPLFITDSKGGAELVNYRVRGRFLVVDTLFAAAELRLSVGTSQKRVRIVREGGTKDEAQ